ncbi:phage tail protein [Yersinia kristensenii]|uniref:phage tail-collar fiber domain-containing protein n=1 Tax=Yersinia kristensenii TaxID=28152 RepID=UPI001C609717|nr:phage tail protein [Yersinia kristensenii]MBW5826507.1 phage tail protein [Yersinia kristensenii]
MSVFLTQAFEQWMAQCAINNLPARPDTLAFARMGREPSRDDTLPPPENITHTVSELKYGHLNSNAIVCSAVIDADVPDFTYDWICLIHRASHTLCGVIKTPERHKAVGETLIRNFVLIYNGIAQAAHITTPPESWQLDINAWLRAGAARATQTLQDFYGHHVFINECARIIWRGNKAHCTQGVAYIAGIRVEIPETVLPALEENEYLYVRAWIDGHTPHGTIITSCQLEHGFTVPDDDNTNHFAPIARLTSVTDWEDLRVTTYRFQEVLETTAESVLSAAQAAQKSQEAAQQAAERAEQATLATLKTANNLSEIADAGTAAQQQAREHLDLGTAATLDVQTERYDRKAGIATPGTFGFGAVFNASEVLNFNSSQSFESWVKYAYPGRYSVSETGVQTIPGVVFSGVIDVIWVERGNPRPDYNAKFIIFYGTNGDIWMNRYWTSGNGYLIGWENLKPKDFDRVLLALRSHGQGGEPGVGGLILAAYQGETDGDEDIKLARGQAISGSRLGRVGIETRYSTSGTSVSAPEFCVMGCNLHPFPGTYQSLSGDGGAFWKRAQVGLFMRVA